MPRAGHSRGRDRTNSDINLHERSVGPVDNWRTGADSVLFVLAHGHIILHLYKSGPDGSIQ